MKAKVILVDRDNEAVERAQNLNLPEPEAKEFNAELFFNLDYIHAAYINPDGDIVVFLPSGSWFLSYDKELWKSIKSYLSNK